MMTSQKFFQFTKLTAISLVLASCGGKPDKKESAQTTASTPVAKEEPAEILIAQPSGIEAPEGMVWVSGVNFTMGAQKGDDRATALEKPAHPVAVDGFFMDATEVTNAQFNKFVEATEYMTVAERAIDWEEMQKQVPPGTPKPPDSVMQPGSLIFRDKLENVNGLADWSQWWEWKIGANWRHPEGPKSSIIGKDNLPVVHISYEDAQAYCKWANRRLPTEAEWEAAAHGKLSGGIYTWGDEEELLPKEANTWQGSFPVKNLEEDGYFGAAPVKSFPPNSLGLYDMAGNVWEWTSDWFDVNYYETALAQGQIKNPTGSARSYNPSAPQQQEKVIKGGSFLCADSYCASYRISARMGNTADSATDHTGFRTVVTVGMLSVRQ